MQEYVLLGMPRTGSTLLLTGLGKNPDILTFGELFHQVEHERRVVHPVQRDGVSYPFDPQQHDAIEFLKEHVYNPALWSHVAVGFKLFAEKVEGPGTERLFARMKDSFPKLKTLQIIRENYLAVLTSREIAKVTNEWVVYNKTSETSSITSAAEKLSRDQRERPTVEIAPDMAQRYFENMERVDRFFSDFFGGPRHLVVYYDDLAREFALQMQNVFEFLGVQSMHVEPAIKKQSSRPLSESISNFEQLRDVFRSTRFEKFFED